MTEVVMIDNSCSCMFLAESYVDVLYQKKGAENFLDALT